MASGHNLNKFSHLFFNNKFFRTSLKEIINPPLPSQKETTKSSHNQWKLNLLIRTSIFITWNSHKSGIFAIANDMWSRRSYLISRFSQRAKKIYRSADRLANTICSVYIMALKNYSLSDLSFEYHLVKKKNRTHCSKVNIASSENFRAKT